MVTKKDKHLAAAQKFLERGSFEKALTEFQQAVKEDSKDTRTWLRMAEVHVRLGQTEKATEVYQKTVDLYVEQGFFQRAVAVYKNIIKLSPDFVDARVKLAGVFRQLGLLSDAVQQLEQAAALYQKTNHLAEALNAIKQIIEVNPDQPTPHIRYAELAAQTGAVKEAIVEFGDAANLLKAQGRTEEFLRVAERLLHYEPQNHAMSKEVAAKYLDHNNARAALARLKSVFEANQRDPEVLDLLARTFDQLGQPHKSLPVLKELARVYAESGRISERNQAAQRALSMDPNDAEMQELLGTPYSSLNKSPHPAMVNPPSTQAPMTQAGSHTPSQVASPAPPAARLNMPGLMPSLTPLPAGPGKRPVAVTFSEMEVPVALRNKYVTLPAEPLPTSMSERINIATGMVEKSDDDSEVKRILAEADVFVKYGLVERAADHLRRVFERVPTHQGAHERLAVVLVQLDRKAEAAAEYEILAQQVLTSKPRTAATFARKALELNPSARRALEVLGIVEGASPGATPSGSDVSDSLELRMGTPEPDIIQSGEIELLGESVESDEFGHVAADGVVPDDGQDRTHSSPLAVPEQEAQQETRDVPFVGGKTNPSASDDLLLADLEQVDFFIEQGLADEATAMLDELEVKYPGHRSMEERRERLAALNPAPRVLQGAVPAQAHGEVASHSSGRRAASAPAPGQEAADIETHADLGIMEKTMERYQAAIEHFKVVMEDPKREVFALTMIGECSESLGDSAEAIRCYQDALKRPSATTAEATQLYYQLGNVFHNLGDHSEALYYFERVYKRDANFRDIRRRLAAVRADSASR